MNDWFETKPDRYRRVRPVYPSALFGWLSEQCESRDLVWDVATGTGQAAVPLARYFDQVFATDRFPGPLNEAPEVEGITWRAEPAEACTLPDHSADLVTTAAGLHWFDTERFGEEARRVLKPGGVLAAWTYTITPGSPGFASLFEDYANGVLAEDWSPVMHHVLSGYEHIDLPGRAIHPPPFAAESRPDLADLLDLMRTWSAAIRYTRRTGEDPVASLLPRIESLWHEEVGEPETRTVLSWPLALRIQRMP